MKILSITATGLPLLKESLQITFYAQQRVSEDDKTSLHLLFSNVYQNPVLGFIGINASGKTTILRLLDFVLKLLNNEPINHIGTRDILGNTKEASFDVLFFSNSGKLERLVTKVVASRNLRNGDRKYSIAEETLYRKETSLIKTRKEMNDYSRGWEIISRDKQENYLPDDVSIMIAENRRNNDSVAVENLLDFTDINVLEYTDEVPYEIIRFLDPSIESLHFERDVQENSYVIRLKFIGKEEIILNNSQKLNHYLSSGTIKGIKTFTDAIGILKQGGYLIVDEIENHFNKEIVATLIRFFLDSDLNSKGGTLIFSTHYPELLDEFTRNDSIYITRNRDGINAENLSRILKRNDIKKSDAYESGYLEGTVPVYEAYITLRKQIIKEITEGTR